MARRFFRAVLTLALCACICNLMQHAFVGAPPMSPMRASHSTELLPRTTSEASPDSSLCGAPAVAVLGVLVAWHLSRSSSLARRAVGGAGSTGGDRSSSSIQASATAAAPSQSGFIEEQEERRFNPDDGRTYTFKELQRWSRRADLTDEEVQAHWEKRCRPLTAQGTPQAAAAPPVIPQALGQLWSLGPLSRMWTAKDAGHLHTISGGLYIVLGALFLLDRAVSDANMFFGTPSATMMSHEFGMLVLALGAFNAGSGLQPAFLGPWKELPSLLGLGDNGNLRTGGYINSSLIWFVLGYQALRMEPSMSAMLAPLDVPMSILSILTVVHANLILNAWVNKGSLPRFASDIIFSPPVLNLPITWHLLTEGQAWVQQMSALYPGWPEFFCTANFALAWAASMATFVLSLYERRVITVELRSILMVLVPLVTIFTVVPLRAAVLVPEWLDAGIWSIITLNPPSA